MDTKALEKFCPWARTELIDAVKRRCTRYGLDDAGRAEADPDSDVVGGRVLDPAERARLLAPIHFSSHSNKRVSLLANVYL